MYINEKNITKLKAMKRHSMSRFAGREIRLYRSYDQGLVMKYHGIRETPGYFEFLMMNYKYGEPQYFIKYPYTNFFVELGSGGASMQGVHEHISCKDPISDIIDPYYYEKKLRKSELEIFRLGERIMMKIGISRHDFLDQVFDSDVLSQEYVQIPDLREVSYAFYSPEFDKYLIVDHSEFNFQYDTMRLFYGDQINGLSILPIENFVRYRDGGTTLFEFEFEGGRYKFFSPSRLGKAEKSKPTLNETELVEFNEADINRFLEQMNILHLQKAEPNGTDH
jgi:hypothetical protein